MYRGRVQLGQFLTLGLQCTGATNTPVAPTSCPEVSIYDGSGTLIVGRYVNEIDNASNMLYVPILDRDNTTGLFQGEFRITSAYAPGPYVVRYSYTYSGSPYVVLDRFDVIAGGDGSGAFISLAFVNRGDATWLVGNTDSGARIAYRNPGV